MLEKPSIRDLDGSFSTLYVVLTLIDGFLFVYEGGQNQELIFTFYFGLNLAPIIILGLIWWGATFFDKIVLRLFAWFMLFTLAMQSLLLVLASLFPPTPFYLFPYTPLFAIPFEYLVYRRYSYVGKHIRSTQRFATILLCLLYSTVQFFWFVFLMFWLLFKVIGWI